MYRPIDRTPVVTGIGLITPIGSDIITFWNSLMIGRSGVRFVQSFDTRNFPTHIGCEIEEKTPREVEGRTHPPGRAAWLGAIAGRQALKQAGLASGILESTGLCIGTTMGEACWLEAWSPEKVIEGAGSVPTEELLRSGPDQIGVDVASMLGLGGPISVLAAACAAGNYSIARAAELVWLGRAQTVIAGGSDSFSRIAYTGFARLGALASDACRPFSADRDGIVLGEGAAMLVVESRASAQQRHATILAEIVGSGLSCDAFQIVSPQPDGEGARRAMQAALSDAELQPDAIDYICAHGTGTRANDAAEVCGVRDVFKAHQVPMSSIKALTGHGLGAASAIEAAACILALQYQIIPPTWNFRAIDSCAVWDIVPNAPRSATLRNVLNNACAFGGINCSVIFRHPESM